MSTENFIMVWIGLAIVTGLIAKLKNRSAANWLGLSLLLSPLICIVALIFMSSLEKYEYEGEPSLNNNNYKIYLTKQYKIEKIETVNKFQCYGEIFDDAFGALRHAQSIDRGMAKDVLEINDQITPEGSETTKNLPDKDQTPLISKSNTSNGTAVTQKKTNGLLTAVIAIAGVGVVLWFAMQYNNTKNDDIIALKNASIDSQYKVDGELAEAFNLNSKYTDIQRDNLLKQIKGKVVAWTVEVYEVKKSTDGVYTIQTSSGLNIRKGDVGTFIELHSTNPNEAKFIEERKTGDRIQIKGILSGDSLLRSLVIKPAILWYPEEKTEDTAIPPAEQEKTDQQAAKAQESIQSSSVPTFFRGERAVEARIPTLIPLKVA